MSAFNLSAWALRHRTLVLFMMLVVAAAGVIEGDCIVTQEDRVFAHIPLHEFVQLFRDCF